MSASPEEVLALARDYVAWDIDSVTGAAVQALIDQNDIAKLTPMMTKRIQFGTAGLRAAMGPGYDKMNDLVILQTSQGLVRYLEAHVTDAREKVSLPLHISTEMPVLHEAFYRALQLDTITVDLERFLRVVLRKRLLQCFWQRVSRFICWRTSWLLLMCLLQFSTLRPLVRIIFVRLLIVLRLIYVETFVLSWYHGHCEPQS